MLIVYWPASSVWPVASGSNEGEPFTMECMETVAEDISPLTALPLMVLISSCASGVELEELLLLSLHPVAIMAAASRAGTVLRDILYSL